VLLRAVMSRPELTAPPEIFYDDAEARKYTSNSRMIEIQERLTQRALELLALPGDGCPKLLLDLGCGSGLSGERLSEEGHVWVGVDISPSMLEVAVERETDGDLLLGNIGQGLGVRTGQFDGAISISAVQWLCNAETTGEDPRKRLKLFFTSLYRSLARGARAVLQIYPDGTEQAEMISTAALRAGFTGGLVVDYPNSTRAKKFFLVLMVGQSAGALPRGRTGEEGDEGGEGGLRVDDRRRKRHKGPKGKPGLATKGSKDWIVKKKDQQRNKGVEVAHDSKYTGRKRARPF